jgi:glutathione peroxidase
MKEMLLLLAALTTGAAAGETPRGFHDYTVTTIDGETFPLSRLKGKKVLVVNVASRCGLTPQYKQLQELQEKYGKEGKFTVIAFPANDFGGQEPGSGEEIKAFCTSRYAVTFPLMAKITVKGEEMAPLYRWLTRGSENGKRDAEVTWNFQKFLIDEEGNWVDSVEPRVLPTDERVTSWIEGK